MLEIFNSNFHRNFRNGRKKEHYPRYYKLGIEKVAYVMPQQYVQNAKEIGKEGGRFELRNFSNYNEATDYLN